ncbi:hypothetical protein FB451DRAFT_1442265 [Mycena latifolia]|nr:hypothetical protein FB451DRAFT_1442265 [Mycena latifolia]
MPLPPTAAQNRLNNIATSLNTAVTTLDVVTQSLKTPFLEPISNTLHSLLTAVQTVKRNQDECAQMLEQTHELLTLHKIHTLIEAEGEKSIIKQFFRQGEMRTLLKGCHTGLEQALEVEGVTVLSNVADMQQHAQRTHQEVLELISAVSEESSDSGSLISRVFSSTYNSSNSFSLLPSEPKIFHGRELEVSVIIQQLNQEIPRIAILGGGGMGKTSLARAILHHPQISAKYQEYRFFIACDAASSSVQLAALIGAHVGLQPGPDLTEPVVRYFLNSGPSLLILDNLETVWEPRECRADVEKFLAFLEDIQHLALIITMRGAERPANIRWTRPFLQPMKPLSQEAARKTFVDIVDDGYAVEDIDRILLLADNMPLAIDLIAHLVDYDGFDSVMHQWETERTSLLSEDADLVQSKLTIENILACKAALLCTSLAYTDDQKRLKALVPIREYMQKIHPPAAYIVQPLFRHFNHLLKVYSTFHGTVSSPVIVARIASNLANIRNVLTSGLKQDNPDLSTTIECACQFERFMRQTGWGQAQLLHQIPDVLPNQRDHRVEVFFIITRLLGYQHNPVPNAEDLMKLAIENLAQFDDPDLKCCINQANCIMFLQNILLENTERLADILSTFAWIKLRTGDYSGSREDAYESQRLARILGNLFMEARALNFVSMCWYTLGRYNQSILLAIRARNLLRLCAMSGGPLDNYILNNQAEVHLLKSEYVAARILRTQILHLPLIEHTPYAHAIALLTVAQIDLEIGASRDGVHRNIDTAKKVFSRMGHSVSMILCDMVTAALAVNEGDLLKAATIFQTCLQSAWGTYTEAASYCLEKLGNTSLWMADSSNWTVTFLVHSLKFKQKLEIHKALQFLGDVYLRDGDQQTAISLFTFALDAFTKMDVHRSRAECMLRLGDISELHGDLPKAVKLWKTARPLFERSSQTKQAAHLDERLGRASNLSEGHLIPFIQLSALNVPTTHPVTIDVAEEDDIQPALIPTA